MRAKLEAAVASAKSNAALASEASERLLRAEDVVARARKTAEEATKRARDAEVSAAKARGDAAAAAREREDALQGALKEAEARYERLANEAKAAEAKAAAAAKERDEKIAALESDLAALGDEAKLAVDSAAAAVASADAARFDAEDTAAAAAAEAAAMYSRLELSLSKAEEDLRAMEALALDELEDVSSHAHHGSSLEYYNNAVVPIASKAKKEDSLDRARAKMVELEALGKSLVATLMKAGMAPETTPLAADDFVPPEGERDAAAKAAWVRVDEMEHAAAVLWSQCEANGLDPVGGVASA